MPFNRLGGLGTPLVSYGTNWVRRDSGLWVAEEPLNLKKDSYILKEGRSAYLYMGTLYYTSNGTFVKAHYPGLRAVRVKVQGGGGGGGGCRVTTTGHSAAAGGGGGGGYSEKFILVDDLAASETVTVGAGGSGGAAAAGNGSSGGASSFGSHCQGNGGGGGNGMDDTASWSWAYEGGAGSASGGDLNIPGSPGIRGIVGRVLGSAGDATRVIQLGAGGDSMLGMGGKDWTNSTTASVGPGGQGRGSGGAGAYRNNTAGSHAGGNGADGIVIVELYG